MRNYPHCPQYLHAQFVGILVGGVVDVIGLLPCEVKEQVGAFQKRCDSKRYIWAKLLATDNGQELLRYTPKDGVKIMAPVADFARGGWQAFRPLRAGTRILAGSAEARVVADNMETVDVVYAGEQARWPWLDLDCSPCLVIG